MRKATLLLLLGTLALVACNTPYALNINEINESGPQQSALIQLSDPQVYAREALINDRRDEIQMLSRLLANSESLSFEPQLQRDLRTISAFVGQLNAAFNPTAGAAATRSEELAQVNQRAALVGAQTAVVRAQQDLLTEQKKLEAIRSGQSDTSATAQPATSPPTSQAGNQAPVASELDIANTGQLLAQAKDLITSLASQPLAPLGSVPIPQTPEEHFRDLAAYRNELRTALAQENLDDTHDYAGNALYRLQFRATVLPGEFKDKFGVARLTVLPLHLTTVELQALYGAWLSRANDILSYTQPSSASSTIESLLESSEIAYEAVINLETHCIERCRSIKLVTPSRFAASYLSNPDLLSMIISNYDVAISALQRNRLLTLKDCKSLSTETTVKLGGEDRSPAYVAQLTLELVQFLPYVINALRPMMQKMDNHDLQVTFDNLTILYKEARRFRDELEDVNPTCSSWQVAARQEAFGRSLERFRDLVLGNQDASLDGGADDDAASGHVLSYATTPTEFVQRVSTAGSAANSLELAMSIAATLPTAGADVKGGVGYLRSAVGRVDAIERIPQVVGFSDRESLCSRSLSRQSGYSAHQGDVETSCTGGARFGWVFGPKVIVDAANNELKLQQSVINQPLAADLSIPGWWPRLDLSLQTAWVGRWYGENGGDVIVETGNPEAVHEETLHVRLPITAAGLDTLTDLMTMRTLGYHPARPEVTAIEPSSIAVCTGDVRLLVQGPNLWRGTDASLNGRSATKIEILPDMSGIAVTFDVRGLPRIPANPNFAELLVWTRSGPATDARLDSGKYPTIELHNADSNQCRAPGTSAGTNLSDVQAVTTHFTVDEPFTLKLADQGVLSAYTSAYIAVRPIPKGSAAPAEWSKTAIGIVPGTLADGLIQQKLSGINFPNGTELQVAFIIQPYPSAELQVYPAHPTSIFYAAGGDKATLVAKEIPDIPQLGNQIRFKLPLNAGKAFPGFNPANSRIVGTSSDQKIRVEGQVSGSPQGKDFSATLRVSDDTRKTFDASRTGDIMLTLHFDTSDSLPAFSEPLTVKKK